jgi:hypothetical protein
MERLTLFADIDVRATGDRLALYPKPLSAS